MKVPSRFSAALLAFATALATVGAPCIAAEPAKNATPDYASAANWVCRPGSEDVCTKALDTKVVAADGSSHVERFAPAADPPIDCFYVYPTVSQEQTDYADMRVTPEVASVVNSQAGRLTAKCRVFAPVYRQATIAHLRANLRGEKHPDSNVPIADVYAAVLYYFAHDNHGRGVVFVGHSQGTIILQKLLADGIDGKPAQAILVAAFLAGDPSFGVPKGAVSGGTLAHIPLCASAAQIGCVYVWGSFEKTGASQPHAFGGPRDDKLRSACVDPAAPNGGIGALKTFVRKEAGAAASDPPWVEKLGQFSGACVDDAAGDALAITALPGRFSAGNEELLQKSALPGGWGLHVLDVALVEGNILDLVDAETKTWLAGRHAP